MKHSLYNDFSIIIPTYNRALSLERCLRSLLSTERIKDDGQIIVVDDGSTDSTRAVALSFERQFRSFKYLYQTNEGPAAARNRGAGKASGEVLVFLDDDCTVPKDWGKRIQAQVKTLLVLGGRSVNGRGDNPFSEIASLIANCILFSCEANGHTSFVFANNLAIRKDIFTEICGFDEHIPGRRAEDRDLSYRLQNAGYPMRFDNELIVYHNDVMDFWGFIRQNYAYGYSNAFVYRKTGSFSRMNCFELFSYILRHAHGFAEKIIYACIFICSQLSNRAGALSLYITRRNNG